jgi:hypothetical protein
MITSRAIGSHHTSHITEAVGTQDTERDPSDEGDSEQAS